MQKIQTYSRYIRFVLLMLLVITPIANLYFWLMVQSEYDFLTSMGIIQLGFDISAFTQEPLTLSARLWAFAASMVPCGILMYAFSILARLFKCYEKAEVFTLDTVKYFNNLGRVFFLWAFGNVIYSGLISVALSFNNPPGERILAITFAGLDLMSIFCGFIVLTIAWVMKEAQQLADEHQHTI
ncbi:hypothetical protein VII00023_12773 [Vibrio ichthyoenteri ATCC 700023]|uniref:DUF2975 domain-containing protein n=1 Tax=Vibrio ichthyoenteri ATCC 700023 TaxID=870968 RepID=F9S2E5_9VIBR|nr:DUF2975 domain-containing protein [Vibrio ichthyoenteri]EGU39632.1 hypothetical protein VII00023_12773 [Vibrio ichthyoenteri ATCC 700023]